MSLQCACCELKFFTWYADTKTDQMFLLLKVIFYSCFSISGTFMWVNCKKPMTINRWNSSDPNGGTDANCVAAYNDRLIDKLCSDTSGAVCEFYN